MPTEPWKRDLVATAVYTGMRKGELLGLERTAVDLDCGTISVVRSHARQTTKGEHRDTIPIARPLRPFLEHALDAASDNELVFPAPDGGRRREDLDAVAIVRTALKRAGLVEGYEHVCRRCKGRGEKDHTIRAQDGEQRKCARCGMRMWAKAIPRHVTFQGSATRRRRCSSARGWILTECSASCATATCRRRPGPTPTFSRRTCAVP